MHGQGDGDAADAQSRQQRFDLHSQVVERKQQHHRPDNQPGREKNNVDGAGQDGVQCLRSLPAPVDGKTHRLHGPQANLHPENRNDDDGENPFDPSGEAQVARCKIDRNGPQKERAGAFHHQPDELYGVGQLLAFRLDPLATPGGYVALNDGQHGERNQESG